MPDGADKGDRVIYYAGGTVQAYVAIGSTDTTWRFARQGAWAGRWWIGTPKPTRLRPPVEGAQVEAALGFRRPRQPMELDAVVGRQLVAFLRGKPQDAVDSALEGLLAESRRRERSPRLRQAALRRASGRCEACGTDFATVLDGRGIRCLVVHHTRQMSSLDTPQVTRVDQLAVVCANCHMLIHSDPSRPMPVEDLRRQLIKDRRSQARRT